MCVDGEVVVIPEEPEVLCPQCLKRARHRMVIEQLVQNLTAREIASLASMIESNVVAKLREMLNNAAGRIVP